MVMMNERILKLGPLLVLFFLSLSYLLSAEENVRAEVEKLLKEAHQKRGDAPLQAEELCKKAMQILEPGSASSGDLMEEERKKLEVRCLNIFILTGYYLGKYKQAVEKGKRSIEIARTIGDTQGKAKAYNNIGLVYIRMGNFGKALESFETSLELYNRLGIDLERANCYNNIGLTFYELGRHDQSLLNYLEALRIYEETGDKFGMSTAYNNIGLIYIELKNYEKALEYLPKALELSRELGEQLGMADGLYNIGLVYGSLKNDTEALNYFNRALAIYRQVKSAAGIAFAQAAIGDVYIRQTRYSLALTAVKEALTVSREIDDQKLLVRALIYMGMISRHKKNFTAALPHYEEALKLAKKINTTDQLASIYLELSLAYEELKNYRESLEYFKLYKNTGDKIFNEQISKKLADAQVKYDSEKQQQQIQLLKKDRDIQNLKLEKVRNDRNFILFTGLLVALLLLGVVLYNRQRAKTRMREEHLKLQQQEAISLLSGGIAHDYNNLLAVIIGYLELLKENVRDDEDTSQMVEIIEETSRQGKELAAKFLDISKSNWVQRREVTFDDILASTADWYPTVKPLLKRVSAPADLKPLYGDLRMLRDMLFNILQNAGEAAGESGQVKIKAENITLESKNEFSPEPGHYVKISITDNGRGIPPEHLGKIFDPYFSTKDKPSQKGMGLGLAICYSIVKKHNGHIRATSEPGAGTTITLHLPVSSSASSVA
jgi:signal transduction histidine kinase/Tfp pilus assembly protein PilF